MLQKLQKGDIYKALEHACSWVRPRGRTSSESWPSDRWMQSTRLNPQTSHNGPERVRTGNPATPGPHIEPKRAAFLWAFKPSPRRVPCNKRYTHIPPTRRNHSEKGFQTKRQNNKTRCSWGCLAVCDAVAEMLLLDHCFS